ncbi:MAG: hypothetical protein A6D91_02995 [Bacillaceae bacterium G1]|nr:QueT transporter family protein [Bacillota bacterium]OJF17822.1 MAG: hypothetical protein A6D91_02995 [Bacillaceae bacterium G1]
MTIRSIAKAAIIAALYVVLTLAFAPFSYGPIQVRVSEMLTVLPIFFIEAIPGLFIGCLLANVLGGLGLWDIIGGSLVTLLAAIGTYWLRRTWFAYACPIVANAFLVSAYLAPMFGVPYWITALYIGLGEAIAVCAFGIPLVIILRKRLEKR